jgi:hypothetical protein
MAAIVASDIVWDYSTKSGSAGNSLTSTAAASLGKYISTSPWAGGCRQRPYSTTSPAPKTLPAQSITAASS